MKNPTTRRYPRTMQEAFGPYTSYDVAEPRRPVDWQDRVVLVACVLTVVVCLSFGLLR